MKQHHYKQYKLMVVIIRIKYVTYEKKKFLSIQMYNKIKINFKNVIKKLFTYLLNRNVCYWYILHFIFFRHLSV
jgi:hypothetical protein